MKKNNIVLIAITIITLFAIVTFATYAYFATGNMNITNVANANTVTERNNMVFDVIGGEIFLNVTAANMVEAKQGNVAAGNDTTLTVNFTPNTDYSMVCSYDIIYEWTSTDRYTTHSPGITDYEFGVFMDLEPNNNVNQGMNYASGFPGIDLADLVGNQNSAVVVSGAQISGIGSTTSTAVWHIISTFINIDADQSALSGKTYSGRFKVANVSCVSGKVKPTLSYWNDYPNTCTFYSHCTFPDYGGTLQTNGLDTGFNVYIGQDDSKYYLCGNDGNNHEVCLSQPYTQYGLEGHTLNSDFTSEQLTSAEQAMYQAFIDAGISDVDCNSYPFGVGCTSTLFNCSLYTDGMLRCSNFGDSSINSPTCNIYVNGQVACDYLD